MTEGYAIGSQTRRAFPGGVQMPPSPPVMAVEPRRVSALRGFSFSAVTRSATFETLVISSQRVISFPGDASQHWDRSVSTSGPSRDSRWNRTRLAMVRLFTSSETHDGNLPSTTPPQSGHILRCPYQNGRQPGEQIFRPCRADFPDLICHRRMPSPPERPRVLRIPLRVYPIATIFFP